MFATCQVEDIELEEPNGWITIDLQKEISSVDAKHAAGPILPANTHTHARMLWPPDEPVRALKLVGQNNPGTQPLRAHLLQARIESMHQNGRDTHIRQIKVSHFIAPLLANTTKTCVAQ